MKVGAELSAVIETKTLGLLMSLVEEPKYISQLADDTGLDRSTTSHHLRKLEEEGLVSSEYRIIERPKSPGGVAARFYTVNPEKLNELHEQLVELLKQLES